MAWVALVLAVAVVALVVVVLRLHVRLAAATARAGEVVVVTDPTQPGRDVIVIEIRNHEDVAARRTRLARTVGLVSPALIRTIVHREAVRQVREQLADEGVLADVRVRRIHP